MKTSNLLLSVTSQVSSTGDDAAGFERALTGLLSDLTSAVSDDTTGLDLGTILGGLTTREFEVVESLLKRQAKGKASANVPPPPPPGGKGKGKRKARTVEEDDADELDKRRSQGKALSKAILILGATGKQGGGVLRALLAHPKFSPDKYTIYAATRNPASASAQRLASLSPSVKLVAGDLRSPAATFEKLPTKLWAVFAITYPGKTELADGIGTIDAAVAAGASHIVFSSVDRGQSSPATDVPHFVTKHKIETHIKSIAVGDISYTIIRPPFFLDNIEPGFLGKVFATIWKDRVQRSMSFIDTSDIGSYGAAALLELESPVYRNAELNVAGDNVTFEKANEIFKRKTGHKITTTFSFLGSLLLFLVPDMAKMFALFNDPGFTAGATAEDSNKLHYMANFEEWVERSKHVQKSN